MVTQWGLRQECFLSSLQQQQREVKPKSKAKATPACVGQALSDPKTAIKMFGFGLNMQVGT